MNHNHNNNNHNHDANGYTFQDFVPLIAIFAIIIALTIVRQLYSGWNLMGAMGDFMGFFFLIFGTFKIINWQGFVQAYRMYDIVAKRSIAYAYAYPLIEVMLGIAYLTRFMPVLTNVVALIVMGVSSIGVAQELGKEHPIACACLGDVFKVPLTYVTLGEDLLMVVMSLFMLYYLLM